MTYWSAVCALAVAAVLLAACGGDQKAASTVSQRTVQQPSSDAPPPHALGPPRLLVSAPGVTAFAQDGGKIAWWTGGPCQALQIRTVATRAETRVPPAGKCAYSDLDQAPETLLMAFAGDQALWSATTHGNFTYEHLQTASLSDPTIRTLGDEITDNDGDVVSGMVGDGATLVYMGYTVPEPSDEEPEPSVSGWAGRVVVGTSTIDHPRGLGGFEVAVSGRLAANLSVTGRDNHGSLLSDASTPVEVREIDTGKVLGRFKHGGQARAIALAPAVVAVLVHDRSSTRIETYSFDGQGLAETNVSPDVTDLALSGDTVVFFSGSRIKVLNARSGRMATVAKPKGVPIGLSIEGSRIAWAEDDGRIVAIYLSAH